MKYKTIDWLGLSLTYNILELGYEGDSSVPGGTRDLGFDVEIISLETPTGDDIYDMLDGSAMDAIERYIIDNEED